MFKIIFYIFLIITFSFSCSTPKVVKNNFSNYNKAIISNNGDILIKSNINVKKQAKDSILTNVFKEMIAKDIKKSRV